jgi:heme-degrading monooxygenase HmoA
MFIQVVQGTVTEPDALMAAVQRWRDEVGPGATGWLGSTSGVTEDGRFIAVVRFASEEDARRNSDRPEQAQWWASTSVLFGDVEFHDCTEVVTFLGGGSDDAGFVQVIQGRVNDEAKLREMMAQADEQIGRTRPDVLGGTVALHGDGGFTQVVYFASEEAARAGEKGEQTPEAQARGEEFMSAFTGPPAFFDLRQPWLSSPR